MAKAIFIGVAQAVSQVDTITMSGTWAAADTVTIKVNARFVKYTCGAGETPTTVATALLALCQAATAPEFKEVTWTSDGAVITATSTAGVPVTITTSDTAAAGASSLSNVTAATGPWHWDNILNWSTGAVPVDSVDEVYVDDPNMIIAYGLPTALTLVKLHVRTGKLGLPDRNPAGYIEYRATRAQITCTNVLIGNQDAKGPSLCRLDLLSGASVVVVYGSGVATNAAAVDLVLNNAAATVAIISGQVAIADGGDETSTVGTVRCSQNAALTVGPGVTITTLTTTGNTIISSNVTNLNVDGGTTTVVGTATVGTATITGGTLVEKSSGTITALVIGPGTLDCSQDIRARTITTTTFHRDAVINDPNNTLTYTNVVVGSDVSTIRTS